jgi:hypothetical protein
MIPLDRQRILDALDELSRRLAQRGATAEVCLFGGAAMILAFQSRQATKDIDAIFAPTALVRELAAEIGRERGYDAGWFNDGVKGFVSEQGQFTPANLPQFSNLRVMMPVPNYLLAMKCLAARVPTPDATDVQDVKFLLRHLSLRDARQVLDLVEAYYPRNLIQPKTQYFVEAVLEEMEHENSP